MAGRPTFPSSAPSLRQPACKPGSVGRMANHARDGHSSATPVARCLKRPTRTADPDADLEKLSAPSLFGFAPGGVCRAAAVAGGAVRSYRTFSPLPRPQPRRFVLCGTFPEVALAGRYPAPRVHGARTFLPGDLSALAGAAVRPTDAIGMGFLAPQVKRFASLSRAAPASPRGAAAFRAWTRRSPRR
jgi:hypothetical protein